MWSRFVHVYLRNSLSRAETRLICLFYQQNSENNWAGGIWLPGDLV